MAYVHEYKYMTDMCIMYTARNVQVATGLLTSCNNLLQQADIRMCFHNL